MYAAKQKKDMNIKCRDVEQNITELSGGNQRKVILGKWMAAESSVPKNFPKKERQSF